MRFYLVFALSTITKKNEYPNKTMANGEGIGFFLFFPFSTGFVLLRVHNVHIVTIRKKYRFGIHYLIVSFVEFSLLFCFVQFSISSSAQVHFLEWCVRCAMCVVYKNNKTMHKITTTIQYNILESKKKNLIQIKKIHTQQTTKTVQKSNE